MVAGRHAGGGEPAETSTVKALVKKGPYHPPLLFVSFHYESQQHSSLSFPCAGNEAGETRAQPQTGHLTVSKDDRLSYQDPQMVSIRSSAPGLLHTSHARLHCNNSAFGEDPTAIGLTSGRYVTLDREEIHQPLSTGQGGQGSLFPDVEICRTGTLMWCQLGADVCSRPDSWVLLRQ